MSNDVYTYDADAIAYTYVKWPGSFGWHFVLRYKGLSPSGRRVWECRNPSGRMVDTMLPTSIESQTKTPLSVLPTEKNPDRDNGKCHAGRDGECNWAPCPQERDGEPIKSGRHCPYDTDREDAYQ